MQKILRCKQMSEPSLGFWIGWNPVKYDSLVSSNKIGGVIENAELYWILDK